MMYILCYLVVGHSGGLILGAVSPSLLSPYISSPSVFFVERRLFRVLRPCPSVVSSDFEKCLVTAFAVKPGQDKNCIFFIAATHVGLVGNPAAAS
jgi:hypothetical protein